MSSMRVIICIAMSVWLMGCSLTSPTYSSSASELNSDTVALSLNSERVRTQLQQQYQSWQGTPYQLGGNTRSGIDCSGFTQTTFSQQFNVGLPRTTARQITAGKQIRKENLLPGDLVFFQTAAKVRHVGIYMGYEEFLHASTSKGVMISQLSNPYWLQAYRTSRRIFSAE